MDMLCISGQSGLLSKFQDSQSFTTLSQEKNPKNKNKQTKNKVMMEEISKPLVISLYNLCFHK